YFSFQEAWGSTRQTVTDLGCIGVLPSDEKDIEEQERGNEGRENEEQKRDEGREQERRWRREMRDSRKVKKKRKVSNIGSGNG
ncbi:hypothetical protein DPMN_136113, partial [Dreissena polymorpha]